MRLRTLHLASIAALAAACATTPTVHDWSTYAGPGAEHFQREEVAFPLYADPLEPLNRTLFDVNEGLFVDVAEPLAQAYRAAVPSVARKGLGRAFTNLLFPVRVVNNLLQGRGHGAWAETQRFVVNTTAGVLGLRDVAARWGIEAHDEDFGRTFQRWGWGTSTYLVAPVFGPTTSRDALGYLAGLPLDVTTYYTPTSLARGFNTLSESLPELAEALRVNYDPYTLARDLYLLEREVAVGVVVDAETGTLARASEQDGATETLASVFLAPDDEDFLERATHHDVLHPLTGRLVPYSVWLQSEPAPVDYILPGLGGHRTSSSAVALAEAVFAAGKTAVTVSSSMNYEFVATALSSSVPGFLPSDAHDTHVLLDAIDRDLRARYPERLTGRRLGGISFGGITTLFIAASRGTPGLIDFDAYLAVNAPLSLQYGATMLDAFYRAPLTIAYEARSAWRAALFQKTLDLARDRLVPMTGELPFTSLEARYLIGLVFRAALRDVIYQTQLQDDLGVLHVPLDPERRTAAYREIDQFSLTEYVYAFVLPYLAARRADITFDEAGARRLFELCDVRSLGPALAANPRVRFATNRNDFLLAPGDLEWITALLGPERVTVFERGGHLGNLHRADIQAVLAREITEAAAEGD